MANEIQMVIITSRFIKLLLVDYIDPMPTTMSPNYDALGVGIQSIQI